MMHLLEKEALWRAVRLHFGEDDADRVIGEIASGWNRESVIYVDHSAESAAQFQFYIALFHERVSAEDGPRKFLTALGAVAPGYRCQNCGAISDHCLVWTGAEETGPVEMGRIVSNAACSVCEEGNVVAVLAYPCAGPCREPGGVMHTAWSVPDRCLGPMLRQASRDRAMERRGYDLERTASNLAMVDTT